MTKLRKSSVVALSLWLGCQAAALANSYPLQSIDFATRSGGDMGIMLNTGSIVPYHKVLVSNNKLVLDIDSVNATERVQTNFAGAPNISHVIIQPLSKDKIRLIIRGEALSNFQVGFGSGAARSSDSSWMDDAETALGELQESGMHAAVYTPEDTSASALKPVAETPAKAPIIDAAAEEESSQDPFEPMGSALPSTKQAPSAPVSVEETLPNGIRPLTESGSLEETGELDSLESGSLLSHLPLGDINPDLAVKGGLLLAVLLGFGIFLLNKVKRMSTASRTLEDLLIENQTTDAPKANFRELADAYRRDRDQDEMAAPAPTLKTGATRPTKNPIGLGALREQPAAEPAPAANPQTIQTPAPAKQALNQYQRQQGVKPQAPAQPQASKPQLPPQRSAADAQLLDELIRARENQQRVRGQVQAQTPQSPSSKQPPVNQARAAQSKISMPNWPQVSKKPAAKTAAASAPARPNNMKRPAQSQQAPLPDNPEVLNFLRNVADLMEKDGKPNLSRSIQKNIK